MSIRRKKLPELKSRRLLRIRPHSRSPKSKLVPDTSNLFSAFLRYHSLNARTMTAFGEPTIPSTAMRVSMSTISEWCHGRWRRIQPRLIEKAAEWFATNYALRVGALDLECLVRTSLPADPERQREAVKQWMESVPRIVSAEVGT